MEVLISWVLWTFHCLILHTVLFAHQPFHLSSQLLKIVVSLISVLFLCWRAHGQVNIIHQEPLAYQMHSIKDNSNSLVSFWEEKKKPQMVNEGKLTCSACRIRFKRLQVLWSWMISYVPFFLALFTLCTEASKLQQEKLFHCFAQSCFPTGLDVDGILLLHHF